MSSAGEIRPGRLWSLLEMLGKYAAAYIMFVEMIDKIVGNLEKIASLPRSSPDDDKAGVGRLALALLGQEPALPQSARDGARAALTALIEGTSSVPFPSVIAQNKRIQAAIERGEGAKTVSSLIKDLKVRLIDELDEREFLYVPSELVAYYKNPMLMGKDVNDRFPLAIDDIEDAGKCLAVQQGTACVLHTMRIMEVGLRALGKALGIPYAPSWESYLKQISDNISKKHKNKTAKWKRDERFYRDVSGDLLTVKQAWRNPTMHVDRRYSVEEAEQIFSAATHFMQRLARHFSEKDMEKLLK